jgi:hypothetical protein
MKIMPYFVFYFVNMVLIDASTIFALLACGSLGLAIGMGFILMAVINIAAVEFIFPSNKTQSGVYELHLGAVLAISNCFWLLLIGPMSLFAAMATGIAYIAIRYCIESTKGEVPPPVIPTAIACAAGPFNSHITEAEVVSACAVGSTNSNNAEVVVASIVVEDADQGHNMPNNLDNN